MVFCVFITLMRSTAIKRFALSVYVKGCTVAESFFARTASEAADALARSTRPGLGTSVAFYGCRTVIGAPGCRRARIMSKRGC